MPVRKTLLHATKLTLDTLTRMLPVDINAHGPGLEYGGPSMYVGNHFTRFEVLLLPYYIYRATGRYAYTLADSSLFAGILGRYLNGMGILSTKREDRDDRIIGDLLTGRGDWVIYPEGSLVKNRRVVSGKKLALHTPYRQGPPHTGAGILALKAEIYRQRCFEAFAQGQAELLDLMHRKFAVHEPGDLSGQDVRVVPVTLSYYPLRPGQTWLARMLMKHMPEMGLPLTEELEIESGILLREGTIDIYFGEPLRVRDFSSGFRMIGRFMPFMRSIDRRNPLLKRAASKLIEAAMAEVYQHPHISLDHLVSTALYELDTDRISRIDLRETVLLVAQALRDSGSLMQRELTRDLARFARGADWPAFNDIVDLAVATGILTEVGDDLVLNRGAMLAPGHFHTIRLENPLRVMANEIAPRRDVAGRVYEWVNADAQARHDAMAAQFPGYLPHEALEPLPELPPLREHPEHCTPVPHPKV